MVHICDGDRAVEATELGSAGHVHLSTPFGFHLCFARRLDRVWFAPLASNGGGSKGINATGKVFTFGAGSEGSCYSSVAFRAVSGRGARIAVTADDTVADQVVDFVALR